MRCTCSSCQAKFAGLAAFEAHRVGAFGHIGRKSSRRCLTPSEMLAAGLVKIVAPASRRYPACSVLWTLSDGGKMAAQATVDGHGAAIDSLTTYLGQMELFGAVPEMAGAADVGRVDRAPVQAMTNNSCC